MDNQVQKSLEFLPSHRTPQHEPVNVFLEVSGSQSQAPQGSIS
jgi:hypothetical protein